jgi:putative ABC transport system permease protein
LGLVIGIASSLVILTIVRYELSFDKFHSDAEKTYRLVRVSGTGMTINKESELRTGISYPVPVALREELASLENITSMEYLGGALVEVPDKSGAITLKFRENRGCVLVDPSFFKVFDFHSTGFKWIEGNLEKALIEPFNVVLTKSIADKYFPNGNALGGTLRFEKQFDCKVTGVVEDLPANSDFPFTIMVSYSSLKMLMGDVSQDWYSVSDEHHTFVVLKPGTTKEEVERQIKVIHASHTPKDLHESRHYLLQQLADVHYDTRFNNYIGRSISKETITALSLVALFLLLTGSINYINLATAQATMRSKEVGLRKVMGSSRKNLIGQLLTETFIVVLIAGIAALGLSEILIWNLQPLLNIELASFNFSDPFVLMSLLLIILLVTLFSGLYPAFSISRYNPITALRNKFATEKVGGFSLRKTLVVAQFTITQMLVVGTFIVVAQIHFFQNTEMGFNREAVVTVSVPDRDAGKRKVMEDQLFSQSFVSGVSFSSSLPSGLRRSRSYQGIGKQNAELPNDYLVYELQFIDPSYLNVYKIKLLAGRNLIPADSTGNILVNRTLAKNLEFLNPADAIGQEVKLGGRGMVTIVGVTDDFYSNSFKDVVDNMGFLINDKAYGNVSIKLNVQPGQGSLSDAVKQIETIWTSTFPEHIFEVDFFDENIKAFYAQEEKFSKLFQLFSLIFLLIGCLGLYGLITFAANRKAKEVAIRKVLGATMSSILMMFSKEYVRLILLSFVIATPVAYYVVTDWLSNFAKPIKLQWWLFLLPGLLVLVIALLVVGTKSFRAANSNPIDKLKYE